MRVRLLLTGTLLLTSTAAFAQPVPISNDLKAFYPPEPLKGELLATTREGCGVFIPAPSPDPKRSYSDVVARELLNVKNDSWGGVCHNGLAQGPGRYLEYWDYTPVFIVNGWMLNGRSFGVTWQISVKNGPVERANSWKGQRYFRNVLGVEPQEALSKAYATVGYKPVIGGSSVRYNLVGAELSQWKDRRNTQVYRCPQGCGSIWVKKAGPLIQESIKFERQHAAEIQSLQTLLTEFLKPMAVQRLRALKASTSVPPPPGVERAKSYTAVTGHWSAP